MRVWFERIARSKSKTFLAFCFFFLAGVAGAFLVPLPVAGVYWYALVILLLAALIFFWPEKSVRLWVGSFLFLLLGIWRVSFAGFDCSSPAQICFYSGRAVTVSGYVAGYPQETIGNIVYTIAVEKISNADTPVNGKILARLPRIPKFNYGDVVALNCRVEQPQTKPGETFEYDKYLAAHNIQALCQFPKDMTKIPDTHGFRLNVFLLQPIFALTDAFYHHAAQLWGEPESSFIIGLLFGGSASLPKDISGAFQRTGLSHVLAVSGFNVTIIATALAGLLVFMGLSRRKVFWVALGALLVFVLMTGATASVVRAAIMGALVLTARYIGRLSHIGIALVATAAVMVLLQPYVLFYDAGFQLSFLATIGLVYVPARLPKFLQKKFGETFVATLSAIIMTLPLLLYQFGIFSLVAPLVNVLVLWSVPYLMLGGFSALIVSFVFFPLGQMVAFLAGIGARIFIFIVQWFSALPFAAINAQIPWWLMLLLYAVILYFLYGQKSSRTR